MYSSTGTEKGYTLTTIVISGPTRKTGYPLTTNNIVKLYLFVTDYNPPWYAEDEKKMRFTNLDPEPGGVSTSQASGAGAQTRCRRPDGTITPTLD